MTHPAIERPSYGRGCNGGENLCGGWCTVYAEAVAVRAGSGEWSRGSIPWEDRPTDGAAWARKFMRGFNRRWEQVAAVCGLAYGGLGCETGLGANSG